MQSLADELARIPWSTLDVASGKAGHVPKALLGLLSPDETVRNTSYWQLDNEVVCQSDLYEASYFVVPFLLKMLHEPVRYGRDRIYDLLFEIANGSAPPTVECRTHEGEQVPLKVASFREVEKGMDVFKRDAVADSDPRIRKKAEELIEALEEAD
jgi:hypothetical protein